MRTQQWVDAQGYTAPPPSSPPPPGLQGLKRRAAVLPPQPANLSVPFVAVGIETANPGPVMSKPISVYILWLGDVTETQKEVFRQFLASIPPNSDQGSTGVLPSGLRYRRGTVRYRSSTVGYILWLEDVTETQKDVFRQSLASIPLNSDQGSTGVHPSGVRYKRGIVRCRRGAVKCRGDTARHTIGTVWYRGGEQWATIMLRYGHPYLNLTSSPESLSLSL